MKQRKKNLISTLPLTLFILTLIGGGFFSSLYAVEIMKLSEIKVGMKGEGKTIFKGSQIETFPFTVLGILQNYAPGRSIIIIEAASPALNESGIIEGMSGSPAYIDGKLVGAIAIGFNFSKKPIGGITPIEDIIKISGYNNPNPPQEIPNLKLEFDKKNLAAISDYARKELARRLNLNSNSAFSPIRLIGMSKGFTGSSYSSLTPMVAQSGGLKITTNSIPITPKSIDKNLLTLSPADAVAVVLVSGDLEYSALGTVTHVDGNNVYIFGHPFFNMGPIDFPMYKAEIITVVPSYESSFKLATIKNMVGSAVQDRSAAVQGVLGKIPYMIPMKVFLKNRNRTFNIEIVNNPLLSPVLTAYSMASIFSSEFQDGGFQTIEVEGKIYIEGEKNIVIDDIYSGTDPLGDFNNLLLAVNYFILNNKEKNIKIQKIDFEITGSESMRVADIENVLIDKKSYLPGEMINITVNLKNERGNSFQEEVTIGAPSLKPGSEFYILVADGEEMSKFDAKNVRSTYFPTGINFLIRAINNLRKNKSLYIKVMTAEEGLFIKGYEYPKLPSGLVDVFMYGKSPIHESSSDAQSTIKYSTLYEYQSELSSVVKGNKLFKLKIKERTDE